MKPALSAGLLALGLLLALPATAADPCAGRNPLHCNSANEPGSEAEAKADPAPATTPEEPADPNVIVDPPGGCAGRNPLFCRETAPKVEVKPAEPPPRERANDSSRNPNRNANQNPNRNPRRRARGGQ